MQAAEPGRSRCTVCESCHCVRPHLTPIPSLRSEAQATETNLTHPVNIHFSCTSSCSLEQTTKLSKYIPLGANDKRKEVAETESAKKGPFPDKMGSVSRSYRDATENTLSPAGIPHAHTLTACPSIYLTDRFTTRGPELHWGLEVPRWQLRREHCQ